PTAAASGDDFRDGCPLDLAAYYFTARRADLPDRQLLVRRQEGVSPRYGLFLTYPLWEGETLSPRRRSSTGSHRRRRWSSGGITPGWPGSPGKDRVYPGERKYSFWRSSGNCGSLYSHFDCGDLGGCHSLHSAKKQERPNHSHVQKIRSNMVVLHKMRSLRLTDP
ncbi:unnamed protein product, partial [Urochloa humidicola]